MPMLARIRNSLFAMQYGLARLESIFSGTLSIKQCSGTDDRRTQRI